MSEPAERAVTVNGEPCRVWEKGNGSPVYYLAGLAGLPRWTPFLDRLAERHRVVAPSVPGFPGAAGHDRLDSLLDWIAAALDLLEGAGLAGGDLIGASIGGALAAEAVAMAPGLVRRYPFVRRAVAEQQMKPLVDPDERGDSGQLILAQGRTIAALQAVQRAGGDPHQAGRFRIRQSPRF